MYLGIEKGRDVILSGRSLCRLRNPWFLGVRKLSACGMCGVRGGWSALVPTGAGGQKNHAK